jgi:hypothetical protein
VILLLCCWLTSQCTLRPIPRDLAVYVNRDIYGIADLENQALKRYAGLTGDNYISDRVLRDSLDTEIIPEYKHFVDLAGHIEPRSEPVQKLHALYCEAAALRLRGFRTVLLAIDTGDPDMVRQANRLLDQGQRLIARWQSRLNQMSAEYGLELY